MRLTFLFLSAWVIAGAEATWVERSNQHAQVLLKVLADFQPEAAAQRGVEGVDERIVDLGPRRDERYRAALEGAVNELRARLRREQHPQVRQDLEIMIRAAQEDIRGIELNRKYLIPYFNVAQSIFFGIRSLLDEQVAAERRPAALVRLRRYAGLEPGYEPMTKLAQARILERMKPGLLGPPRVEVETHLRNAGFFLSGLRELFEKYRLSGWEPALAKLEEQIQGYNEWVKEEILPRSRTDFRLPAELYEFGLKQYGVDVSPEELRQKARAAFADLQKQMQQLAPKVAEARGWKLTDYREVIRELKKQQLVGEAIVPHYRQRIGQLEEIISKHELATLPARPARMRLATAAETAAQPAPHMRPPRLIGNRGESGEFVLPLNVPAEGEQALRYDDFTFEAASWTLTAHEVRPGHEMQFAAMVERGVSIARAVFAFNSANVEGWGLYSEFIAAPYFPLEGQLIGLQHRLMRAARAFIDPELHMGKMKPEEGRAILKEQVVLSEAMTKQELERYMFRAPGQATAYFYGYSRLLELRREVERKLGAQFQPKRFHDFILGQGLVPPDLLRKAVMAELVKH